MTKAPFACCAFGVLFCSASAEMRREATFRASCDGSEQLYVELVPDGFRAERGALVALHGHGSDRYQFADNPRGECKAARDAARERGVTNFYFCGGSMGGTSALTFVARHPSLVKGIVALNPLADHLAYTNFQEAIAACC